MMATGHSHPQTDIRRIEAEAREWFLLRGERPLTASEQSAFDDWMSLALHCQAYAQLEQIERSLVAIAASEEGARLRRPTAAAAWMEQLRHYIGVSPFSGIAFACTLLLAIGVVYLAPWQDETGSQAYASALAQVRDITLQDGTQVTLGGDSAIEAAFDGDRREVKLLRGQAFFHVSKDPTRPFFVRADGAEVRVVGTRFDVRAGDRLYPAVKVTVEEGVVEVAASPLRSDPGPVSSGVRLTAGQQVQVSKRQVGPIRKLDSAQVAGWREGKFSYRDAPLSEIVADANRYREDRIVIGTRELENLRVTTAFTAEQVDTLVAMLEQSLPVRVFREPDGRVVIWPGTMQD